MIEDTSEMIRPYVEKDPTKFCTVDDFEKGVSALSGFVTLRAEAVSRQLSGDNTSVDTADLNLSDMGTMNRGMDGGMGKKPDSSSFEKREGQSGSCPGENMDFDPRSGGMPGNMTGTSDTTKWILVGVSVLVLAAGLFAATKRSSHII